MSNVHLILGGIRSGKSGYAEKLAGESDLPTVYAATGLAIDAEMEQRIRRHRERRPPHWFTLEEPLELAKRLGEVLDARMERQTVIVDSIDGWIANLLMEHEDQPEKDLEQMILGATDHLLGVMGGSPAVAFLVSAEVGLSLVSVEPLGRGFQDILGLVNQRIADCASRVTLVVTGLPVAIKESAAP